MKVIVLFLGFVLCSNAYASAPRCVDNLWVKDGVVFFNGGENCSGKVIACSHQGTKIEGWYSYPAKSGKFVNLDNCSQSLIAGEKLVCRNKGTKSEGWYDSRGLVKWEKCAGEEITCMNKGTRYEGWVSFPSRERTLIFREVGCSQEEQE